MATVSLICAGCGQPFEKHKAEYDRRTRLGQSTFYHNQSCANTYIQLDELSMFRTVYRSARSRAKLKKIEFSLTLMDLKEKWEEQQGVCPYTKKKMFFAKEKQPGAASIDRVDSSKGYTKNNIEFVCLFINYGKNGFLKQQVIDFLGAIV